MSQARVRAVAEKAFDAPGFHLAPDDKGSFTPLRLTGTGRAPAISFRATSAPRRSSLGISSPTATTAGAISRGSGPRRTRSRTRRNLRRASFDRGSPYSNVKHVTDVIQNNVLADIRYVQKYLEVNF